MYEPLKTALVSHSRTLRLNALRLLTSSVIQAPEGSAELLKKALQAEEISIDVQGVRERVLRIGRLPVVVKDGDEVAAEICARWLIGVSPLIEDSVRPVLTATSPAQGQPPTPVGSCCHRAVEPV